MPIAMVCRHHAASSVAIPLARSGGWLDDADVHSIVHRLGHEDGGRPPPLAGTGSATRSVILGHAPAGATTCWLGVPARRCSRE